jgi:hypothetical protein
MTLSRRRLGLQLRLLDSSNSNNRQFLVMRNLLFVQRARRRLVVEVGRVPSLLPHHREERAATAVDRGET